MNGVATSAYEKALVAKGYIFSERGYFQKHIKLTIESILSLGANRSILRYFDTIMVIWEMLKNKRQF